MTDIDKHKRIVITGIGVVCPIGHSVDDFWQNLLDNKSGAAATTIFDASTYPTQFSAEVKDYDLSNFVNRPQLHKTANRGSSFCLGAAVQACRQAKIDIETDSPRDGIDRTRLGIYLGAGEGSVDNDVFFEAIAESYDSDTKTIDWESWANVAFSKMSPMAELEQEPNMPVTHLGILTGARGPVRSCLTACAASTQAIGEAMIMLRQGQADIMLTGGAHSMIHPLGVMGFNRLTALSTRNDSPETASRPFSATRDGFVIGEGGAILIMETLESAKKRNVTPLAELIGYGSTSDAFRVTDMHADARGAIGAIEAAIEDAGIDRYDIDYVSTHGTSTSENDSIETKAIKGVFGDRAGDIPVSSIKSVMGHLIGATGATELISCILAIQNNMLPATMNLHDADPALDLDYVANSARPAKIDIAMNESFGFGGQNNVVIIKRFSDN